MKILRKMKKGFTIVELVIVIAVIAILTAILVPTFINLSNKANRASDQTFKNYLNKALVLVENDPELNKNGENVTMQNAIEDLESYGISLNKITTKSDEKLVWKLSENRFYFESEISSDAEKLGCWKIMNSYQAGQKFSIYAGSKFPAGAVDVDGVGFDVGYHKDIDTVNYSNSVAGREVIIRTDGGKINIGAQGTVAKGTVVHYGSTDKAIVYTEMNSFHTHGVVQYLDLKEGKSVADEGGIIYLMKAESETAAAEENGGVIIIPSNATTEDIKTDDLPDGYEVTATGTTQPEEIKEKIAENQGLLGSGTQADPFQVYDFESMQKVSLFYETSYSYFSVNIARTNNGQIDCTGWIPVKLNGSFDGKGVSFTNVTAVLFMSVGYQLRQDNIVLKDFDATMNVSSNGMYGAAALIKNIFNAGTTTFDHVNVHGYLEGYWNMGSFYNYGTANYDDKGADYEVIFNSCTSDATLVCASGNTIGGLLGHSYEGANHSFTMRVNNSQYTGHMYLTTTSGKGNKYFGMTSDYYNSRNHFFFNDVEDTFNNGSPKNAGAYTNSTKISNAKATKGSEGYNVVKQGNVSKIVATVTAQLTAYDEHDVQIANASGITMVISGKEITSFEGDSVKVLDLFESVNLVLNAESYDSDITAGVLNIRIGSDENYKTGNIRLQVNQYDSTGSIISAGTIDLAVRSNLAGSWIVQ